MKKILISCIATLLCTSCVVFNYSIATDVVDLRRYNTKNFHITISDNIQGSTSVTPIGSIYVKMSNIYEWGKVSDSCISSMKNDTTTMEILQRFNFTEYGVRDFAVAKLVAQAVELGANGITNFDITFSQSKYDTGCIVVSGFAVEIE